MRCIITRPSAWTGRT